MWCFFLCVSAVVWEGVQFLKVLLWLGWGRGSRMLRGCLRSWCAYRMILCGLRDCSKGRCMSESQNVGLESRPSYMNGRIPQATLRKVLPGAAIKDV